METQLWIGDNNFLTQTIETFLTSKFCPQQSESCFCSTCKKIQSNQHANIVWINPAKGYYVTSDIDIIFEKTVYALGDDESFFFIINNAESLGITCSNKLLKVLEEPPSGYNFILLSNNLNAILPTIRSRSLIKQFQVDSSKILLHPILDHLLNKSDDPIEFDAILRKYSLSEHDSIGLLNELFAYIGKKYTASNNDQSLEKILNHIKLAMYSPPQPGGSNLFWKNLYISFPR